MMRVRLAVQNGKERLKQELDQSHPPSVGMVVIIPQDTSYEPHLKQYINDRRGKIFRTDIPVEVLPRTKRGSGNVYLEARQFVRKYTSLKKGSTVMYIFHLNNGIQDDDVLDWHIMNGYQVAASQENAVSKEPVNEGLGREIIIYSRDAYFGTFQQFSNGNDITFLTNWVSASALGQADLMDLEAGPDGIHVRGIFEQIFI